MSGLEQDRVIIFDTTLRDGGTAPAAAPEAGKDAPKDAPKEAPKDPIKK